MFDAPTTSDRERKQLLRAILTEVVVSVDRVSEQHAAELRVVWEGGAVSEHSLPLPRTGSHTRSTDQHTVALVRQLAERYADKQIAAILARQGRRTGAGNRSPPTASPGCAPTTRSPPLPSEQAPRMDSVFLSLAEGEGEALSLLRSYASWLGLDEAALEAYEPHAGCQGYTAFVSWLALNGSRADVALAFAANLAAWGDNCGRLARALRERYGAPEEAVAFFDFFATPPEAVHARLLAVVEEGLTAGESPAGAARAARLLQAYELMFWDALAEPA